MKKLIIVILLFGVTLSLCVQNANFDEIRQKAIDAAKNVKTYRFKMVVESEVIVGNGSSGVRSKSLSNVTGTIDLRDKRLCMNVSTTIDRFGQRFTIKSETIVVNDTAYIKSVHPNGTVKWFKSEVDEGFWNRSDQMDQQIELLRISKIESISDEVVNGVECYAIKLKPDLDKFAEFVAKENASSLRKMLKDVEVELWVAKDDFYPVKTEVVTVVESPMVIAMGSLKGNVSIKRITKTTVEFFDINEPVSIELPATAKNATSIEH